VHTEERVPEENRKLPIRLRFSVERIGIPEKVETVSSLTRTTITKSPVQTSFAKHLQ